MYKLAILCMCVCVISCANRTQQAHNNDCSRKHLLDSRDGVDFIAPCFLATLDNGNHLLMARGEYQFLYQIENNGEQIYHSMASFIDSPADGMWIYIDAKEQHHMLRWFLERRGPKYVQHLLENKRFSNYVELVIKEQTCGAMDLHVSLRLHDREYSGCGEFLSNGLRSLNYID